MILKKKVFSIRQSNIEQGLYIYSTKQDSSHYFYTKRLRSKEIYFFKKGTVIKYNTHSCNVMLCKMTTRQASSWNVTNLAVGTSGTYIFKDDYYVAINISNQTETTITLSDYNSEITVYENIGDVDGKNVHVYNFGGKGNDWCFVRTPQNYEHKRRKPYPFVICNHGNGWVMNGDIQFANWTKRTMYVPKTDEDYIASPTQYNGTDDESLWYSNPTIEALLNAGYVVCGCENYGDNLFGNDDCRNACVDFFYHMVKNYNVEERCCMIGASNGAQTTINASYLLGEKVKAIILQYPLTCLTDHYENYSAHQSSIRSAYGIADSSITKDNLIKATATHDFMHTNVIANTKVGYFPPTKLYYSEQDTVVNYNVNAVAMYNLLIDSLKVAERVKCSGQHGDYTHFNPNEYLEWFERF